MYTFKEIDNNSTVLEQNVVNYTHDFSNSTPGVNYIKIISGSSNNNYWNSLNVLFYTSGSPAYTNENKFSTMNFSIKQPKGIQHLNKFHGYGTSSLFTFPQSYYGEKIKEGSFILRDSSHPSGTIIIKDDKFGNLYAENNTISHSTNHTSHSDNYVGNIFYDYGLVVVTETSSYSHTASTASITVGTMTGPATAGANSFFITGSDLSASIEFISTGSFASETETDSIKYFASASTSANTAASGTIKINEVFGGLHISASVSSNVISLTNDANQLNSRRTTNTNDDLPPISGSAGFATTAGFGGGVASILYTDVGTTFTSKLESQHQISTYEYSVTLQPQEFNKSMNYSLRMPLSGSYTNLSELTSSIISNPYLATEFTGSAFSPYITTINLYQNGDHDTPAIIAHLPKPIKKSKKISTTFKIRLDI
tara:strand:- start:843 stop:2120 length:1278 start_codon:yes stop_codon:yes gene_type:complete